MAAKGSGVNQELERSSVHLSFRPPSATLYVRNATLGRLGLLLQDSAESTHLLMA